MDKLFGFTHFSLKILLACLLVINGLALTGNKTHAAADGIASRDPSSSLIYIPAVLKPGPLVPIINVPYFAGQTPNYHQAAVFWFGQVRGNENYADVRVGYDDTEIYVRVSVFDRYLWYDTSPIAANLTLWDAVTLYLDLDGNTNYALDGNTYRFVGQLNWWGPRDNYQAAYQGSSTGWNLVPLTFSTSSGWRGNAPNDTTEDRGYVLTFHLPFTSLGPSGPPSAGTR